MKKILVILFIFNIYIVAPVLAQGLKIGVVNSERILRDSQAAKAATAQLEKEFSKLEQKLVKTGGELQADFAKFKREMPTMTEEERLKNEKSLQQREAKYQERKNLFQENLAAKKLEKMQDLLEKANVTIEKIAKIGKYDLILREALYYSSNIDLTDKVIKEMDEK